MYARAAILPTSHSGLPGNSRWSASKVSGRIGGTVCPDMVKRRGPREKWGITEGKARRILNLTDGSEKPVGDWNRLDIECLGDQIKVWVNGDLVNHGTGCTASKGQIALQAEGSEVEFRKLELSEITTLSD